MKIATFLLWNAFLMLSLIVRAGTLPPPDPEMEIDNGSASTPVGGIFTFFSNANGGGAINLQNVSGFLWIRVDVTVPFRLLPDQNLNDYHCHAGDVGSFEAFTTCSIVIDSHNNLLVTFQGVNPPAGSFDTNEVVVCCQGVPNQGHFIVGLGEDGWGPNQQFQAQANVPEPGSMFLVAPVVLGVWWVNRRRYRVPGRRFAELNSPSGRTQRPASGTRDRRVTQ